LKRVSVIIPAYNAESCRGEAVASVLAQSHGDMECIVVDDGSTDRTAEIVRGYGNRVCFIRQENSERSAARNKGIAHATGEYLSFLDADDLLLAEKSKEQLLFLETNLEYDVVYSRAAYFRDDGRRRIYAARRIIPTGDIVPFLIWSNFITINSLLFRKSVVDRVAGFDPSLCRYEDWDLLLRLALTGSRFGFVDSVHALCRMHGGNTVVDGARMFEAKLSVARKIADEFGNELSARGIDGGAVTAFHLADYGRKLILAGRVLEGRRFIREACENRFPHRIIFKIFSIAAVLYGHRFLSLLQTLSDCILKYRRTSEGDG